MSLIPYKTDEDRVTELPHNDLVVMSSPHGPLRLYSQIFPDDGPLPGTHTEGTTGNHNPFAESLNSNGFVCPTCGSNINHSSSTSSNQLKLAQFPSRKYFNLLESRHKEQPQEVDETYSESSPDSIPSGLFTQGYFRKFFTVDSLLGHGARATVYKVTHKIGSFRIGTFALKKIPIGNNLPWFNKTLHEVRALTSLSHKCPNLITYNHVWLERDYTQALVTEKTERKHKVACVFILQQYCDGGNLEDVLEKNVFWKDWDHLPIAQRKLFFKKYKKQKKIGLHTKQIASIIKDIATGLQELHEVGLIHRDLKPSNCLLLTKYVQDSEIFPTVVISDLGESQLKGEYRSATGATGTLEFTAPELIITPKLSEHKKVNQFTFASDMYSLGMIIYFLLFAELPFDINEELSLLKQNIKNFTFNKEELKKKHTAADNLNKVSPLLFDLMESLLSNNPTERPSASDVILFMNHLLNLQDENFSTNNMNQRKNSITNSITQSIMDKEETEEESQESSSGMFEDDELLPELGQLKSNDSLVAFTNKPSSALENWQLDLPLFLLGNLEENHLTSIVTYITFTLNSLIIFQQVHNETLEKYRFLISGFLFGLYLNSSFNKKLIISFLIILIALLPGSF